MDGDEFPGATGYWKMKTKWIACLSIAATTLVLPTGPLHAEELTGGKAEAREWLCPTGNTKMTAEPDRLRADRDAIEDLMTDWAEAVVEADVEAIAALVTEDAEFWTHGAAPLVGRRALIAAFEPFLEKFEFQQQFDCKELIIGGAWAFMRGMETNQLTPRDGGEIVVRKQRAFSVLRRETNGKWLFARGMTNLPLPEKTIE